MSSLRLLNSTACLRQFAKCESYSRVTWLQSRFRRRSTSFSTEAPVASSPLIGPHPSNETKSYPAKLTGIVDQISKLTLVEVAELNELLKKTLNIPDTPMMTMGAMPLATAAAPVEEDEEEIPKSKTSFTVKLLKFDDTKKVLLIKELKTQIEGMNLVQAKKFVESAPQIVRADIGKDEAEKIVATLQAVGGTCEIV